MEKGGGGVLGNVTISGGQLCPCIYFEHEAKTWAMPHVGVDGYIFLRGQELERA